MNARDDYPLIVRSWPTDYEIANFPHDHDVQCWRQAEQALDEIDDLREAGDRLRRDVAVLVGKLGQAESELRTLRSDTYGGEP